MRWRNGRQSDNVEDRRGMSIPRGAKIGGGSGLGLIAVVLIGLIFDIDPTVLLQGGPDIQTPSVSVQQSGHPAVRDDLRDFVAVVLADTEDVWDGVFRKVGRTYQPPTLVLFSGAVESACGMAGAAGGPVYCPPAHKNYLGFC